MLCILQLYSTVLCIAGEMCIFPKGDIYLEQYYPNAIKNFDRSDLEVIVKYHFKQLYKYSALLIWEIKCLSHSSNLKLFLNFHYHSILVIVENISSPIFLLPGIVQLCGSTLQPSSPWLSEYSKFAPRFFTEQGMIDWFYKTAGFKRQTDTYVQYVQKIICCKTLYMYLL